MDYILAALKKPYVVMMDGITCAHIYCGPEPRLTYNFF